MSLSLIQKVAVWVLPVLFAITVHEVGHGWMARQLGDRTAQMLGRLTLNPVKHIDPIGTVLVPALLLMLGGLVLGWAKPVPVTVANLRRPRRDMAWVALAGPAANLLMAIAWALVVRVGVVYHGDLGGFATPLLLMGVAGIFINSILLVVNLLPVPPLDGGRILMSVLPGPLAWQVGRLEPFGILVLLALLASGLLGRLMAPAMRLLEGAFATAAGVSATDYRLVLAALLGVD